MSISIVRLGTPRAADEGLRIGTVRRPPRGVPASERSRRNFYDVWLPVLSPSAALVSRAKAADSDADWRRFERLYRAEMTKSDASGVLDLLAALSRTTNLSVGCYCDNEARCHRSVLRQLLAQRGADVRAASGLRLA